VAESNSTTQVEYRPIQGFPGYRVGSDGTVWTAWKYNGHQPRKLSEDFRLLKPGHQTFGYPAVGLYRQGKCVRRTVHALVLEAFVGPAPQGMEARHYPDRDPENCRLDNLQWATHRTNIGDRVEHGTAPRGTKNGLAKVTESDVLRIRTLLAARIPPIDIASEYHVSVSTIRAIKNNQNWKWLR
jgi:hypothetical protein